MNDLRVIVLDASVVAKWHLHDEDLIESAMALRSAYAAGRLSVFMPDVARYEVANLFSVAAQQGRVSSAAARRSVQDFLALGFTFVGTAELILDAMDASERLDCASYDAAYLVVAEEVGCDMVTADRRLVHRLGARAPYVKWLGDYRLDSTPPDARVSNEE